jgi:hypothetical protein
MFLNNPFWDKAKNQPQTFQKQMGTGGNSGINGPTECVIVCTVFHHPFFWGDHFDPKKYDRTAKRAVKLPHLRDARKKRLKKL